MELVYISLNVFAVRVLKLEARRLLVAEYPAKSTGSGTRKNRSIGPIIVLEVGTPSSLLRKNNFPSFANASALFVKLSNLPSIVVSSLYPSDSFNAFSFFITLVDF